jgi:pilus assembly protein CpaF
MVDYKELLKEIRPQVSSGLDITRDYCDDEVLEFIEKYILDKSHTIYIPFKYKKQLIDDIFNSLRRLDILQKLMDDKTITEIMINGRDNIFVEKNGAIYKKDMTFESEERLYNVIQQIVSKVNRVVNESSPIVDARLFDGSRVNAVLPPIALNGPILTIRRFPETPITIDSLIEYGTITEDAADFLRNIVIAKYNIFVCGGTGAGKTTLLNVLSDFIPSNERVITIEDSAELQILGIDNIVKLETRRSNTEGRGEITIRDLIKTSLRMRPDRIIVGEVRGEEALDMLQAMNTGHDGSLSTGHANSAKDMLSRLETMVLCGAILPAEAVRQQIASAIDIIIYIGRVKDNGRKILEISELVDYKDGNYILNELYLYSREKENKVFLQRTSNNLINTQKLDLGGVAI